LWQAIQHGPVVLDDVRAHPWTKNFVPAYQVINTLAFILAPFIHDGKWVACIGVGSSEPRHWQTAEKELLENVVARVWPLIERARAEDALRYSEQRFRAMGDNITALAWIADPDGSFVWYNKRWYKYTGTTLEEMRGWAWEKVHHPDHLPHVLASWKKALAGGETWEDTFPLRGADGKYRWFLSRASPVRDSDGKITLWFGTNSDITELRETQEALRDANARLANKATHLEAIVQERTAKLRDTIGELEAFSYSVSHDLRTPLRTMQGYSRVLLNDYSDKFDPQGRDFLVRINRASERLDRLTQDVLTYSRVVRGQISMAPISLERLLPDIIQQYPGFQTHRVDIVIRSPLLDVMGHEASLIQCLSNLIGNAVKFVLPGSKPHINIWTEAAPQAQAVKIWIQDNGIGIEAQQIKRIFGIFELASMEYEGTGIGLAIVRKAAERMGGSVGVESAPGQGSRFWLLLPAVRA
jgi:PAS domain S-box-containing protein